MQNVGKSAQRIAIWALVLGLLVSVPADWGRWDHFPLNALWRVLITAVGGVVGLVLNYFAGNYVGMGTNVIESMGITRFSGDTQQKIENSFVFFGAFVAAIIAFIFVR